MNCGSLRAFDTPNLLQHATEPFPAPIALGAANQDAIPSGFSYCGVVHHPSHDELLSLVRYANAPQPDPLAKAKAVYEAVLARISTGEVLAEGHAPTGVRVPAPPCFCSARGLLPAARQS